MITNIFNNVKVSTKLMWFLVVPVVFMLLFSSLTILEKMEQRNNAIHSQQFIEVSLLLANLVNELQKERGFSAGFVESEGVRFDKELEEQRKLTDGKLELFNVSFRQYIQKYRDLNQTGGFEHIEERLQQLTGVRAMVDDLGKIDTFFDFYSQLNTLAINSIENLRAITNNVYLARNWQAYTTLLWLQESAGLERGWINGIFASGEIATSNFLKASAYVAVQNKLLRDFEIVSTAEQQALLESNIDHPEIKKMQALRAAVFNKLDRNDMLNGLQILIGYGGMIHDFKNYVIRGLPYHYQRFQRMLLEASQLIDGYRQLPGMTREHLGYLDDIEKTFNLYRTYMDKVSVLRKGGAYIDEIDKIVKVDDSPALAAINNLRQDTALFDAEQWWKSATLRLEKIKEVSDKEVLGIEHKASQIALESTRILYFYMVVTCAALSFAAYIGFLLWKRVSGEISTISSTMQAMVKDLGNHEVLSVNGNDEITEMAEAFNLLITERKRASDALERQQKNLEELVRERTHELEKAWHVAEDAMETKSAFLANMSHEIRTPMNGVISATELLYETGLDEKQRGLVEIIDSSGRILLSVINQVLDISKIEADKMQLSPEPCSVVQILEDSVKVVALKAEGKDLKLEWDVDDSVPPYVMLDINYLRQVLLNLISNAVKFTEQGSVSIFATLSKNSKKGMVLEISVKDTGIGIPEDRLEAIFGEFVQADTSTTRRFGGTGLGLTIARHIIRLMGGEIYVNSHYREGAEFTISLPVKPATVTPKKEDVTQVCKFFDNVRVLLAEDNAFNQLVARSILEQQGCHVQLANNGQQALEAFRRDDFDLILMDCQMPVMDGYEATKFIRQEELETGIRIPIVAMTANAMPGDREHCIDVGMDDYLSKPIDRKKLFDMLSKFLTKNELKS